jgi:hypothetical protein
MLLTTVKKYLPTFGVYGSSFALLVFIFLLPEFAHAAVTPLSSGFQIFPSACNCSQITSNGITGPSAPAWGCIMQTFQNIITFIIGFAVILITVFLAWAGFTYMTSGGNPGKHELANKRIMNAVIGLLIVLCAYLLVDSILKVIYNPSNPNFGPWNSILGGNPGEDCLSIVNPPNAGPSTSNPASTAGNASSPTTPAGAVNGPGSCSASTVQSGAAAGGYTISTAEANTLACIAGAESTCGTNSNTSSGSSARGPWQVLMQTNAAAYNNPACEAAVNTTSPLNCQNGFSGGNSLNNSTSQVCTQAAANVSCSASAAAYMVQNGGYSAWVPPANPQGAKQQACVAQYAGG